MTEDNRDDISRLFSKVNEVAQQSAITSAIVTRIEDAIKNLHCGRHDDRLKVVEEKAFALQSIWTFILGGGTLIAVVIGVVNLFR